MMKNTIQPTQRSQRIQSLDILRGFAILGILLMNIQSFSMPSAAYSNPMAYGDMNGANKWVWILCHVFADQKFMAIFSMLYGAGIVLVTQNAERKFGKSARLHYSRTFWLLLIGLVHAHLIWYGDILVAYAICALIVYLLRKLRPSRLLVLGVILISVHSLIYLVFGMGIPHMPAEALEEISQSWAPSREALVQEIEGFTGSLGQQIAQNSELALFLETFVFLTLFLWRAGGLMLVGMAFFKWGIFSAQKSKKFYIRGWAIGWGIGLPIVSYGVYRNFVAGFSLEFSMFWGSQFNYWGSLLVAFGHVCLVMLVTKSSILQSLKSRLAAVGQMALTNYIAQSVIAVFIFFGVGLGLFGTVDRTGQLWITLGIWLVQLVWSQAWLSRYRFGPLEWVWRSLTYGKRQPWRYSSENSSHSDSSAGMNA